MEVYLNLELEDLVIDGVVEQWKKVCTIDGLENVRDWYWVSSLGRVKSTRGNEKILKQMDNRRYLKIDLRTSDRKRKMMSVHRLVALAFVEGFQDGLVCNHLDEDSKNNHYSNLEWCTQKQNVNHGTAIERRVKKITNGITSKAVVGTCVTTGKVIKFPSTAEAQRNGFNSSHISSCCRGKRKTHKGFKWSYKESA